LGLSAAGADKDPAPLFYPAQGLIGWYPFIFEHAFFSLQLQIPNSPSRVNQMIASGFRFNPWEGTMNSPTIIQQLTLSGYTPVSNFFKFQEQWKNYQAANHITN
jgi:hypothetical protein